jgi:CheY-like chemotaxis protein
MTTYEMVTRSAPGTDDACMGRSEGMSVLARRHSAVPWMLVVDDDPIAARATARMVTSAIGVRVAVVGSVEDALRLVTRAASAPLALVLDYDLRGSEKGVSVLLSLRAAGFEVPCAFHTGASAEARSALRRNRLEGGYPVFEKGQPGGSDLLTWLTERLGSLDDPHRSGVRSKVTGES